MNRIAAAFLFTFLLSSARVHAADLSLKSAQITPVNAAWTKSLPKDPSLATSLYLARLSPEALKRSNAYFQGGYWLQLWNFLLGIGISWFLLSSQWSFRLGEWSRKKTGSLFLQTGIYSVIYILVANLLAFPLEIYDGYLRQHEYGLANQDFLSWLKDQLIGQGISIVFGSLVIVIIYAVVRKFPKTWHVWGAVSAIGFIAFFMLIGPVWIDPLFNTYKPLEPGPVRESLLSLARGNGIDAHEIYQFDASRQTDSISANVSGIFGTASIRLNDNLLKRCSLSEIKAVTGHEMGHYVLNHVYKGILQFAFIIFIGFFFLKAAASAVIERYGSKWGIGGIADPVALPLHAAILSLFFFVITPVTNTASRSFETEADIFGLNTSREPDGFAEAGLKLTEYRKPDPGPIEEWIFYDHPSPRSRIFSAMRWKSENE